MSTSEIPPETGPVLDVIPLGGLGEFGMNMLLVAWEELPLLSLPHVGGGIPSQKGGER